MACKGHASWRDRLPPEGGGSLCEELACKWEKTRVSGRKACGLGVGKARRIVSPVEREISAIIASCPKLRAPQVVPAGVRAG
mmetsp:Transcript_27682/g.60289  ORF Transcript_27682/g.60289 Transcript_27682/m.60289 type:complete len:82 (+) Transcript_27682:1-246(+)